MGLSPEQEQGPFVLGDVSLDGAMMGAADSSREEEEVVFDEEEEEDAYGGMSDVPAARSEFDFLLASSSLLCSIFLVVD